MCSCRGTRADRLVGATDPIFENQLRSKPLPPYFDGSRTGEWDGGWECGKTTYLCGEPESCGGETEGGRGQKAGMGEVEGQKDHVPEEILRGKRGVLARCGRMDRSRNST